MQQQAGVPFEIFGFIKSSSITQCIWTRAVRQCLPPVWLVKKQSMKEASVVDRSGDKAAPHQILDASPGAQRDHDAHAGGALGLDLLRLSVFAIENANRVTKQNQRKPELATHSATYRRRERNTSSTDRSLSWFVSSAST